MKTILIVDDQPGIRLLLEEVFTKEGFRVLTAGSGKEALEKTADICPDLVLLDMKIPGMDGLEILRRLKERRTDVLAIMMTAYGELDLIEESLARGAVRHFTKPFDVFELRDTVMSLLDV